MDRIFISDMVVRGIIGVHDHERRSPQEIGICIELFADLAQAGISDSLSDTIDYSDVSEKVRAHAAQCQRFTVEALAADIAGIALSLPHVAFVRVRVEKPRAAHSCRSVGVEIERHRPAAEALDSASQHGGSHATTSHFSFCLGIGSNVDAERNLNAAVEELGSLFSIEAVSDVWESPAHGQTAPNYFNAAILARSALPAHELIAVLKQTERKLGRIRDSCSSHVPIDIDLLVFNGAIQRAELWNLAYQAVPMAELLPDLRNPQTTESLTQASGRLASTSVISRRPMRLHPSLPTG